MSRCAVFAVQILFCATGLAGSLQLASTRDPSQDCVTGAGESHTVAMTPDGNSVLFESTALNLTALTNDSPFSGNPRVLNVYLRNRNSQQTRLVSASYDAASAGNADSFARAVSTNGNLVLFESKADNLASGDTNNASDIFLRNLAQGITTLISRATNGQAANGESREAVMTPDGRYVAFVSAANNLVPGDTNGIPDIFLRDTLTATTFLVSTGAVSAGASSSGRPALSADGRYVAFYSSATNLVSGLRTTNDIYVRDMQSGTTVCASTYARPALFAAQQTSNAFCYAHTISADGSAVAYEVTRTSNPATPAFLGVVLRYNVAFGTTDVVATNAYVSSTAFEISPGLSISADGRFVAFVSRSNSVPATTWATVWDGQTATNIIASRNLSNTVSPRATCDEPVIAPDGSWVSFLSSSTNLVTNSLSGTYHLYLNYLPAGPTLLLDRDTNNAGVALNAMTVPCVSADGRFAAFDTSYEGLVAHDRNNASDVFVTDLQNLGSVELISARNASLLSSSPNGGSSFGLGSLSTDGRFCVFSSDADNVVANDTNACSDVFVRDLIGDTNLLVSANTNGNAGDKASFDGSVSGDGRYVAFTSRAADLVANDTNSTVDVFVRDLQTGTTTLASMSTSGTVGNGDSYSPQLSADGRLVLFRSKASNLTGTSAGATENLCVRDLQLATNYLLNANSDPLACARMTVDGRYVVFGTSSLNSYWYIWDTQLARRTYTNSVAGGVTNVAISPSGERVAWAGLSGVFVKNVTLNVVDTLSSGVAAPNPGLSFSADSRWLAYTRLTNNLNQICLFDLVAKTNLLLSRSWSNNLPASGHSDSPAISGDGRFVAYRSFASDIVPSDTHAKTHVLVYDRQTDTTVLLSANTNTTNAANDHSLRPVFSADSQSLAFETWSSDLVTGDFNGNTDVVLWRVFNSNSIPLFALRIASASAPTVLTWPAQAGVNYKVQFKNHLSDANWSDLPATVTIIGNQAYCSDPSGVPRRFYRVATF